MMTESNTENSSFLKKFLLSNIDSELDIFFWSLFFACVIWALLETELSIISKFSAQSFSILCKISLN